MILLICGSREWTDHVLIQDLLADLIDLGIKPTVIHGNCRGADKLGGRAARRHKLPVFACDAQWDNYGPAAGPIRNSWMADMRPDLVWAFHENIMESKGTKDMLQRAARLDIPARIWEK